MFRSLAVTMTLAITLVVGLGQALENKRTIAAKKSKRH